MAEVPSSSDRRTVVVTAPELAEGFPHVLPTDKVGTITVPLAPGQLVDFTLTFGGTEITATAQVQGSDEVRAVVLAY